MIDQIFDVQFTVNEQMHDPLCIKLSAAAFKSAYRELDCVNNRLEKHPMRNQIMELIAETYECWEGSVLKPLTEFLGVGPAKQDQSVLHVKLLLFVV
jgi:hypothetical protein